MEDGGLINSMLRMTDLLLKPCHPSYKIDCSSFPRCDFCHMAYGFLNILIADTSYREPGTLTENVYSA